MVKVLEKKENAKPTAEQIYIEEQRVIAENLKNQAVEFYNPGPGVYDGYQRDQYLDSLNPEIRDLVSGQLNFTKNTFEVGAFPPHFILEYLCSLLFIIFFLPLLLLFSLFFHNHKPL